MIPKRDVSLGLEALTLTSWLGTRGFGTGREGGPPHPAVMGPSPASAIALKPQVGRLAEP